MARARGGVRAPVFVKNQEEWVWGWDPTPGIVSVWAEANGEATIWRRDPSTDAIVREVTHFRPWLLLDSLDDVQHLGGALGRDDASDNDPGGADARGDRARRGDTHSADRRDDGARNGNARSDVRYTILDGPGELRYLVSANHWRTLSNAILVGASARLGHRVAHLRELDRERSLILPPEEQYLVVTGRTYFRDLAFSQLRRLQFDLETHGLDAKRHRVFMIAVRDHTGTVELLESRDNTDKAEAELIGQLVATVRDRDPDVIENHNLHGFDLPFLQQRAQQLGVPLSLGRLGHRRLLQRAARRGVHSEHDSTRRVRYIAPGRELIDTLDAVRRYDFSTRELPSYGLKAVARHFGISGPERELVRGDQIFRVYQRDPARVRRYATADVVEVAALAELLGGAAFALARMAPRRYERLADAGAATGVIDPLLVRAYLREGQALPTHREGDGTAHRGAALHLFATGVAHRVVKADVASLYPSLMRAFRIGPARDHVGALLALVDCLVVQRLSAKTLARTAPPNSTARHTHEAMSAAMKLVINSAYGYLAAGGGLTRFADVHAANEVTRRGRETLSLMCRELAARGVTLLEADTDGVYFAVPPAWTEQDERRVVAEVAALLPSLVQLEFEGRYAAMLSHEPKNYALLAYNGTLTVRGVAFRSSRAEPFGDAFLRQALGRLLVGDVVGVRSCYLDTLGALHRRELSTAALSSRARLTKSPERYAATRDQRREFAYEAMLASGHATWRTGDRVRVYRTRAGTGAVVNELGGDEPDTAAHDSRDYDIDHYARLLRRTFVSRFARAFTPADFATVFADAEQLPLFATQLGDVQSILETHSADEFTSVD